MDKQKVYDEIQQIYEDSRMEAKIACWIAEKIELFLPKGWKTSFVIAGWRGLCIMRSSFEGGHPVEEFKLINKLVEQVTKQKPHKDSWEYEGSITGLLAQFYYPITDNYNLTISVRLFDTKECKTIIKDKMIKQAELLDDCLA